MARQIDSQTRRAGRYVSDGRDPVERLGWDIVRPIAPRPVDAATAATPVGRP